jgi:hypothetical protein
MALPLSMLVMTRGEVDLVAQLVECLKSAYGDEYAEAPGEDQLRSLLAVPWSRVLSADGDSTLHRVVLALGAGDDQNETNTDGLIRGFCKEVRDLASDDGPGIVHVVRFISPEQLRHHETLYREIYELEMRLREVLTYIFLDKVPRHPHTFLDGNAVKLAGDKSHQTPEYLQAHSENQLFHVLFDDYDDLNQNPVARPTDLLPLIRDNPDYDGLRNAVMDAPIRTDRHVIFLAALRELVPGIEAVRNAIAHNRDLSRNTRETYDLAKPRLLTLIEEFWAAERGDGANGAGAPE